ncbi:MAG: replicative DNA helicase, partial [Clostridia bacterium]|nr:replicative DNA helicase [Clostridia bacterium]
KNIQPKGDNVMASTVNTMPYNRDAEMALLGCLLIDNEIAADIVEKLAEDDFYQESHKYILRAMKRVFNDRKPVDLVTVSDDLEKEGALEKAGGIVYLTELTQITPSTANYKSYYEIISRDSVNRKLIRASRKIIETSMKGVDEKTSLAFAEKSIYDISKQTERSALLSMNDDDIIGDVLQKFEKLQSDQDAFKGIPTGFKRLDRMTNGLQAGALIVLAARPGMGKTSLAMNLVEHAALRAGKTCAVFSLEMPRHEIVQRLICSYANVSMKNALSGELSAKEWKKLMLAGDQLKKSNIYIDDSSRVTPAEILSKCRRLKTTAGGVDMIMIDYIQLMSSGDSNMAGAENRQQEVASITRDLKIMAKELGVPVIALSQLRRIQSKEPQLSDLRESGAIEQDADIVMFINRPEAIATKEEIESGQVVKGAAELILAKHRAGEQGRVSLKFVGEYTKFLDVDDQNREDEPPQYGTQPVQYEDDDVEYEAPDDDYGYPEPPAPRKSELKAADDELPFE